MTSTGSPPATRTALAGRPVGTAVTARGRELAADATVGDARRAFASSSVKLLPVLDGTAYVAAVERDDLDPEIPDSDPVLPYALARPPVATASTPVGQALTALDETGGDRLVVLADDRTTYVGLVCLRPDRERLCIDADCHAAPALPGGISPDTAVADLVLERPARARVLDDLGIDYCCGGRRPFGEACRAAGLEPADVASALAAPLEPDAEDVDWAARPLAELVDHIVTVHHAYLREELAPLGALVARVARVHGDAAPELHDVEGVFERLAGELRTHMAAEELEAFPACLACERDPGAARGTAEEQVRAMVHDHEEVAAGLARLRALTDRFTPPPGACTSWRAMLDRLAALDRDIRRHVHEENNVLFPRALAHAAG